MSDSLGIISDPATDVFKLVWQVRQSNLLRVSAPHGLIRASETESAAAKAQDLAKI